MKSQPSQPSGHGSERGATLFVVAASLVVLLAACGLAIDLVALYVGRSEAQRAADAAALAGADTFVTSGYTGGAVTAASLCPTSATSPPSGIAGTAAASVGQSNHVGGQALASSAFTATCDFSHNVVNGISDDPLITVSVTAPMPTYFMKIFGITSENVSASATAEAFSPNNGTACFSCIKPFFLPNCDYASGHTSPKNNSCPQDTTKKGNGANGFAGYWVDPTSGQPSHPGTYPAGFRGEPWQLHTASGPSKFFEVAFSETPGAGTTCSGSQSKPQFEQSVEKCTTVSFACGSKLCALDGKANGPNGHSVGCLISYGATCTSQSVTSTDSISTVSPFTITAGPGNPFASSGTITQSASLITVPIYDGTLLTPGNSQGLAETIVGWMQLFIQDVKHQGNDDNIDVIVLNVTGCGTAGGGGGGACGGAVGGGASFLPVRLVQHP